MEEEQIRVQPGRPVQGLVTFILREIGSHWDKWFY